MLQLHYYINDCFGTFKYFPFQYLVCALKLNVFEASVGQNKTLKDIMLGIFHYCPTFYRPQNSID